MQPRFIHASPDQRACAACGRALQLRGVDDVTLTTPAKDTDASQVSMQVTCFGCGLVQEVVLPLGGPIAWRGAPNSLLDRLSASAAASTHHLTDATEAAKFRAYFWARAHRLLVRADRLAAGRHNEV